MTKAYYGNIKLPEDKLLLVSIDDDFILIDPAYACDYIGLMICKLLFETLLSIDYRTGKVIPEVARDYEVLDEGKTYKFHLKTDRKWSNGDIVTACDFEYAFKRIINPLTSSPSSFLLYDIENAEEINSGKIHDLRKLGVKAVNEFTLLIKLNYQLKLFS